jgi:hypothetical protein
MTMKITRSRRAWNLVLALAAAGAFAVSMRAAGQQSGGNAAPPIDPDDIGGVVTSGAGPEAGVWVIAETTGLPTTFREIVVTDDRGRYVLPDLPRTSGSYKLWVRGYGLVDSDPITAPAGQQVALKAVVAPNPRAAAQYYPASYWYSLIKVPDASEFPGTGPQGNGIAPAMATQAHWISAMKDGCQLCHQMGGKATREIPSALGKFASSVEAWDRRVKVGQRGQQMSGAMTRFGRDRALKMFADWSDRIAAGELPPPPPRPQGAERNLVLRMWEWATPTSYIHDEVASDKRNPRVNASGRVYGVDFTQDKMTWVDVLEHKTGAEPLPVLAPGAPSYMPRRVEVPSPYWGDELIWNNTANPHNPMMDARGRVWMTAAVRPAQNPKHCGRGAGNPFGDNYPLEGSSRQAAVYDPATGKMTPVDTCFSTHHLQFAEDRDNTVYFSGDSNVIGWINTRVWDDTHDSAKAQGWCPMVVDTNADRRIGEYTEPNRPLDPKKDMRLAGFPYGIVVSPTDGSVWWAYAGVPGRIMRLDIGSNPPATCRTEVYEPPFNPSAPNGIAGFTPRGIDVDRNGVIWTALSGGPHMASFDRRKCKVLDGPSATGQHCADGWKVYPAPGPQMKGVTNSGSADFPYYNWVDQFDTLGLGPNVPIMDGSGSDSLLALLPDTGRWVVLRVPYPLGFYSRGLDGRIDNAGTGWKGRGVWATYGSNLMWHLEGGKGTRGSLVKFQIRPNPLAH